MHGDIVPSRHDFSGLIPLWRDVGVWTVENAEDLLAGSATPLEVGPGHVAEERAARAGIAIEKQRQVAGFEVSIVLRDKGGERISLDGAVQLVEIIFGEVVGDIHG